MNQFEQIEILLVEDNPEDAEMTMRALRKRNLVNQGFEIRTSTPAELAAFSAREIERWAQMVKEAKIDPE